MPADERRKSLIEATKPLVQNYGLSFTTHQVADAAGVAEGTIFRVFDSKQDLLEAVVADILDPEPVVQAITALTDHETLEQRVQDIVSIVQSHATVAAQFFAGLHTAASCSGPHNKPHKPFHGKNQQRLADEITDAIANNLEPWSTQLRVDPHTAANFLCSVAISSSHHLFIGDNAPAVIADFIVHGINKDSSC